MNKYKYNKKTVNICTVCNMYYTCSCYAKLQDIQELEAMYIYMYMYTDFRITQLTCSSKCTLL